jgi:cytochrome b involved in lipid metabolism
MGSPVFSLVLLFTLCCEAINLSQLRRQSSSKSCWMAVNGRVYDVTRFLYKHPGGPKILLQNCGTDASKLFNGKPHRPNALNLVKKLFLGDLTEIEAEAEL